MRHWTNTFESNREAAEFILAHPENETLDCLRRWAKMFLERHGLTSPITLDPPPVMASGSPLQRCLW